MQAIETHYNGYRFRSRLEARWAVFFDALGIAYEYEKEGYDLGKDGWYLPDFWVPAHDCFIEIKGDGAPEGWDQKPLALACSSEKRVHVALGALGEHRWKSFGEPLTHATPIDALYAGAIHMFRPDPDDWNFDGQLQLHCPVCRFEYVHFDAPALTESDSYTAWEGRGNALRVGMWCESGHAWTLRFGFHKGGTFFAFENVTSPVEDFGLYLARDDQQAYETAIATARSARFEHGEQPAPLLPLAPDRPPPRFGEHPQWTSTVMVEGLVLATTLAPCAACGCHLWGHKDGELLCDECGILIPMQPYTVVGDAGAWINYHVAAGVERERITRGGGRG